jgi:hypothetical protein
MDRLGEKLLAIWYYLQPVSYLVVLSLWTFALWGHTEEPVAHRVIRLEDDYRALREATLRQFRKSRQALERAVRP